MVGTVMMAAAHSDWRNVRRTSRTALDRSPNADAIIGDEAVSTPSANRIIPNDRLNPSAAAASSFAPSQPSRMTSVAWISCIVRFASISGQASERVARSSPRQSLPHSCTVSARFIARAVSS